MESESWGKINRKEPSAAKPQGNEDSFHHEAIHELTLARRE